MFEPFVQSFKRDILVVYRHRTSWMNPLVFFVLIILLFPLAITPDPQKLASIGPGVIWVALLFAILLSLDQLFSQDYEDGTLEQLALSPSSFVLAILAKLSVFCLVTLVPLLMITALISQFFFLSLHCVNILVISLLLGAPVLVLLGALACALTLSTQNQGVVLILIILPLYLPVLIFGANAANEAALNQPVIAQLVLLGAFLTLALTFLPYAIIGALRMSLE